MEKFEKMDKFLKKTWNEVLDTIKSRADFLFDFKVDKDATYHDSTLIDVKEAKFPAVLEGLSEYLSQVMRTIRLTHVSDHGGLFQFSMKATYYDAFREICRTGFRFEQFPTVAKVSQGTLVWKSEEVEELYLRIAARNITTEFYQLTEDGQDMQVVEEKVPSKLEMLQTGEMVVGRVLPPEIKSVMNTEYKPALATIKISELKQVL